MAGEDRGRWITFDGVPSHDVTGTDEHRLDNPHLAFLERGDYKFMINLNALYNQSRITVISRTTRPSSRGSGNRRLTVVGIPDSSSIVSGSCCANWPSEVYWNNPLRAL